MDQHEPRPRNTREFLVRWNAATEEHLVQKAATALAHLAPGGISEAQAAALAPVLVRALQVAAAPDGGAHVGVHYLEELVDGGGEWATASVGAYTRSNRSRRVTIASPIRHR